MNQVFDVSTLTPRMFEGLTYCVGGGTVSRQGSLRLAIGPTPSGRYANAQVDDYHQDSQFVWRPPLRLTVVARFSAPGEVLSGTSGFGFWNDPVGMTGRVRVRLPQSIWFFFAGGPNCLPLVLGDPGRGWRAATLNAATRQGALTVPIAPLLALGMRVPRLGGRLWGWLQRVLRLYGTELDADSMSAWHRYEINWQPDFVQFSVDDREVGHTDVIIRGPLGLVTWIDNQYMVATPTGRVGHGTVSTPGQGLELDQLTIEQ